MELRDSPDLRVHGEITDRRQQEGRIVTKESQPEIASPAEQATDTNTGTATGTDRGMVVVHVKRPPAFPGGILAAGAASILIPKESLVIGFAHPILAPKMPIPLIFGVSNIAHFREVTHLRKFGMR